MTTLLRMRAPGCGRALRTRHDLRQSARMPSTPRRPPELHGTVFRGSDVVRAGRLTKGQLRSSAWRRLFPDVYACATLPPDHVYRARAAAALAVPGSVVSGRSAAVLWGVPLAGPDDDVELTIAPGCRGGSVAGIRVLRRALPADDVVRRHGIRVTSPRGCRSVRRAAELADGLAELPQETRVRLVVHGSRLPPPVAQYTVRDRDGHFLARADFAWPEARLLLEYEGVWHGQAQQVGRDRRRTTLLRMRVGRGGQRRAGRSGGTARTPNTSRSATRAARSPHMPCTAGPGGVAEDAMYTPWTGVR